MRNRRWICLLLAVLMVLACTACGAKTNDDASGDVRTLTDGKNRTVEVPKQVDRVVCVGVGALRYSCYVGAADRVVGVEDYETKAGMSRLYNYVNFDKFKDLPVTGTNGEPYVEQIIDVAPQVIVMSAYASCDADELSAKTGIPVFVVPGSDTTLDDAAYETIRLLGELYGLETRAQELAKYLKGIQTDLDTRTAKIADDQKHPKKDSQPHNNSIITAPHCIYKFTSDSRLRPFCAHPRQKPRRHDRANRRVQHRHRAGARLGPGCDLPGLQWYAPDQRRLSGESCIL